MVIIEVITKTSYAYRWLSPLIHVSTLFLFILLYRYGERVGRVVDAYFAVLFIFFAFSQNIAVTESYGFVILTGNLVMILIVGLFWILEAFKPQNNYVFQRLPAWRYWVVPFSILAFWFPYGPELEPDFSLLLLLTSDFGVTFCPTTPVVITLLTLIYPGVNARLLTVTSLVGFMIGLFNAASLFLMPGYSLWMLFLHTPLILISFYGLIIPLVVARVQVEKS